MGMFQVVSHIDKPNVKLKILSSPEVGSGEIECLCGKKVYGEDYNWKCNSCKKEYMGPVMIV